MTARQTGLVSLERVNELLSYDPETGAFKWRVARSRNRAGGIAGFVDRDGYRKIRIDGRMYQAHRLAWFITHERWPKVWLDHINHDRGSTKLADLREATYSGNNQNRAVGTNNKTGHKGVSRCARNGKWYACIGINGRNKNLGLFDTPELASAAYARAADAHYGEFAHY